MKNKNGMNKERSTNLPILTEKDIHARPHSTSNSCYALSVEKPARDSPVF
jgi:hypothetical protein